MTHCLSEKLMNSWIYSIIGSTFIHTCKSSNLLIQNLFLIFYRKGQGWHPPCQMEMGQCQAVWSSAFTQMWNGLCNRPRQPCILFWGCVRWGTIYYLIIIVFCNVKLPPVDVQKSCWKLHWNSHLLDLYMAVYRLNILHPYRNWKCCFMKYFAFFMKEEDEEQLEGKFFNEFYLLDMEKNKWFLVNLR